MGSHHLSDFGVRYSAGSCRPLPGCRKRRTLLGWNPEIAAVRERVTEEKKAAEAETAEKVPQHELARPRPEEKPATKSKPAPEEAKPPTAVAKPETKEDEARKSPKRVASNGMNKEPAILFFPLPPIQESGLGKPPIKPEPLPLRNPSDRIALQACYYMSDFDIRYINKNNSLEIWTKSDSEYGKLRLASLKTEAGKLHFEWTAEARQRKMHAETLRDGILKIVPENNDNYYVLLRGSKIIEERPLSLGPRTQRLMWDDLSTRSLPLEWAKNDSFVGTKWPLGIRKWRISSILPGESSPKVLAWGDGPTLPSEVKAAIIPNEAWVRLVIDTKNKEPHLIKVFLSFEKERVIRRWADRNRLEQLLHQKQKTRGEHDEMVMLQNRLGSPEHIRRVRDIERHLLPPSYAELSVIIGLRIDASTVLNIAKFGDFASSSN